MEKGVPVVLVSRCFNGIAEPVYAYEGGGVKLQEAGVMFVKELNAPKLASNSSSHSVPDSKVKN